MGTPYFGNRKRRPHHWKLRAIGTRDLFIRHGWGLCGGYARKMINGREVVMTLTSKGDHCCIYRFDLKQDLWATISMAEREREAKERRTTFKVVLPQPAGTDEYEP